MKKSIIILLVIFTASATLLFSQSGNKEWVYKALKNLQQIRVRTKLQEQMQDLKTKLRREAAVTEGKTRVNRKNQEELIALWRTMTSSRGVFQNRFLGISTAQHPLDVWITQEIISEVKPDFIVETGTYHGGSALLWAVFLENINPNGRVITIDIKDQRDQRSLDLPISRRSVDFLLGSSTDPSIVAEVLRRVQGKKVLVILDSLHTREHVLNELKAYSTVVSIGSYIIVQDTSVGEIGEAIKEFLAENDCFLVDHRRERFVLTNNVYGYLTRVEKQTPEILMKLGYTDHTGNSIGDAALSTRIKKPLAVGNDERSAGGNSR